MGQFSNIILLVMVMSSCSPSNLLKRSERLKNRAIERGALVTRDTIWNTQVIKLKGPEGKLPLNILLNPKFKTYNNVFKDTIIWKNRIKIEFRDKFVNVDCPDSVTTIKTPAIINEKISAGYTWWDLLKAGLLGAVLSGLSLMLYTALKRK